MSSPKLLTCKKSTRRISRFQDLESSLSRTQSGLSRRARKKFVKRRPYSSSTSSLETEDFIKEIDWIKERVTFLNDSSLSLWDDQHHNETAVAFISNVWMKTLFAGVIATKDRIELVLSIDELPRGFDDIRELAYFIRSGNFQLSVKSIDSIVQFGTIKTLQTPASAMQMIGKVLYPHICSAQSWPEASTREMNAHLHRLMASLTECKTQVDGKTELYFPILLDDWIRTCSDPLKDRQFVQHLECLAEHWRKQIKGLLNFHNDTTVVESEGPLDEIAFWKSRANELSRLSAQLDSPEAKRVISTLEATKSSNLPAVQQVMIQMKESTAEAEDIIKYLILLKDPFEKLASSNVSNMEALFPTVLNSVRVVSSISMHYNTKERLTRLLRKISSEIIKICKAELELSHMLSGINVEENSRTLLSAIKCGEAWKKMYKRVATSNNRQKNDKTKGGSWTFDENSLFALMDAFLQRCHDLYDICQGFSQFSVDYADEGGEGFQLMLSLKDSHVEDALLDIKHMFLRQVSEINNLDYDILNLRNSNWHEDFRSFKSGVKELTVMYKNAVKAAFETVTNLDVAIRRMELFQFLAKKEDIQVCLDQQAIRIRTIFTKLCDQIKLEFDEYQQLNRNATDSEPRYAGAAKWCTSMICYVQFHWKKLECSKYSLVKECDEAEEARNSILSSLEGYRLKCYQTWSHQLSASGIASDADHRLCNSLIKKNGKSIFCNFDLDLLSMFSEVCEWQRLEGEGFEVPTALSSRALSWENFRCSRDRVLLAVAAYNEVIGLLDDKTFQLFKDHINLLDRKAHQGLSKRLNWKTSGAIIHRYAEAVVREADNLKEIVKLFLFRKGKITDFCCLVENSLLLSWTEDESYRDLSFYKLQAEKRIEVAKKFTDTSEHVFELVQNMFYDFKGRSEHVADAFQDLLSDINSQIENSLRKNVITSLMTLTGAMNGTTGRLPLCVVISEVRSNYLGFRPSMIEIRDCVNTMTKNLVNLVKVIKPFCVKDFDIENNEKQPRRLFVETISELDEVLSLVAEVMNESSLCTEQVNAQLELWDEFKSLWDMDKDSYMRRYSKARYSVQRFKQDIDRYMKIVMDIRNKPDTCEIGFIRVDNTSLKSYLEHQSLSWQASLTDLLRQKCEKELFEGWNKLHESKSILSAPLTDFSSLRLAVQCKESWIGQQSFEYQLDEIRDGFFVLNDLNVVIEDEVNMILKSFPDAWTSLKESLSMAEELINAGKKTVKQQLDSNLKSFLNRVDEVKINFMLNVPQLKPTLFEPEYALEVVSAHQSIVDNLYNEEKELIAGFSIFGIDMHFNKDLGDLLAILSVSRSVWSSYNIWKTRIAELSDLTLQFIDLAQFENAIQDFSNYTSGLKSSIGQWDILVAFDCSIEIYKAIVPTIGQLKNDALRSRHWSIICREVGAKQDFDVRTLRFHEMFKIGLARHKEFINEVSNSATKEMQIERALKNFEDKWNDLSLDLSPYKSAYKIRAVDEIQEILDEDSVITCTLKTSRFSAPFRDKIQQIESMFSQITDTLLSLLSLQRKWLHLEGIFSSGGDIQRHLPVEHDMFGLVNMRYASLMTTLNSNPKISMLNSLDLCIQLRDMDRKLEIVQKALEEYLEMKRAAFPRFYFISSDDLLEILGQHKDVNVIQKHLKKCFEGVSTLRLISGGQIADAVVAPDGETLEFIVNQSFSGEAEKMFSSILLAVQSAASRSLKECIISYRSKDVSEWLRGHQGQFLITTGAIVFNISCTKALHSISIGRNKKAMIALKKKQTSLLRRLTNLVVNDSINTVERVKLVSLITSEIHNRDIMEKLIQNCCSDIQDFLWRSQLRFQYDATRNEQVACTIRQNDCTLLWCKEYQGNNGRLVVTPLTDRCILTLLTALFLHRCGNPLGPAGTGKTETVKDLAKSLAQFCVVTNCSEGMDYKSLGKIFSGLCQSGSWGCFDEFNRIKIEVISVVAVQIKSILDAQRSYQSLFSFMGAEISCSQDAGIFITMNPGYTGRTELPDNLKAIMRPIAMMLPDLNLIAEVMLASEGFTDARLLARKTITLYCLMQQQLSKQKHYDYGLRNLKSVLSMAGAQKRTDPSLAEDEVLVSSIVVMNEAKFLEGDLMLFQALIQDIFTSCNSVSLFEQSSLKTIVQNEMKSKCLQEALFLSKKISQLCESQNFRHSNMIIGDAKTGKSTIWKVLAQAKSFQAGLKIGDKSQRLLYHIINPKSLSITQLYGAYDLQTLEWHEGVFSKIFKRCANDRSSRENWIVFDGPVDALWIENLNSTMDDNKLLTLINGDRVPLSSSMSLVFEVADLSVASPATISRTGMIFVPTDLGWEPYALSWIKKKFEANPRMQDFHKSLIERLLKPIMAIKKNKCSEIYDTSVVTSLKSLFAVYESIVYSLPGSNREVFQSGTNSDNALNGTLSKCFAFSLVWSVMNTVNCGNRAILDSSIRDIVSFFPTGGTIFDYYYDPKKDEFEAWKSLLPTWKAHVGEKFHEIFVPTIDSIRISFVISLLVRSGHPVLLAGESGIGKTKQMSSVLSGLTDAFSTFKMNFSTTTSSDVAQEMLERVLERRSRCKLGPIGGNKLIVFIDDFHLPKKTSIESPSQPSLELIRQFMDYKGWYDRSNGDFLQIEDVSLVAAMGNNGIEGICKRNLTNFCLIVGTQPPSAQVEYIFQNILSNYLCSGPGLDTKSISILFSKATVLLYDSVSSTFMPTPEKLHYSFSLRDIARVVQGFLLIGKKTLQSRELAMFLWAHECMRVFGDKLISDEDEKHLLKIVFNSLSNTFNVDISTIKKLMEDKSQRPIFTHLGSESYELYKSVDEIQGVLEAKLRFQSRHSHLILFEDAMRHLCRIHRVLMQERGHALLIGLNGYGRRSLTQLAVHLSEMKFISINPTSKYVKSEFREDLRKIFRMCGIDNTTTVLHLDDSNLKDDFYLEDICMTISSGEIPNLFTREDLININNSLRPIAEQFGATTESEIWNLFTKRVSTNLHFILTFSPTSQDYQQRCQMFPQILSFMSIDWFHPWSKSALNHVAQTLIEESCQTHLSNKSSIADAFEAIYTESFSGSKKVRQQNGGSVYILPIHYIDSMKNFLKLFERKQMDLEDQRHKLLNGLRRLTDGKEEILKMAEILDRKKQAIDIEQHDCEIMMDKLRTEQNIVQDQECYVKVESMNIATQKSDCEKIAAEAKTDLDKALPILEKALEEVANLDKKKIFEVKSYKTPPEPVEKVMSCVMIILGRPTDWTSAKKALGESDFLSSLKNVNSKDIPFSTLSRVSHFIADESFSAEKISEKSSKAAGALCSWCHAIYSCANVFNDVKPKRERVEAAEALSAEKEQALSDKVSHLADLQDKLVRLKGQFEEKVRNRDMLRYEAEVLHQKLITAKRLIEGLNDEYIRWSKSINDYERRLLNVSGDAMVASASLAYLGPFDMSNRIAMMNNWIKSIQECGISISYNFTLFNFLSCPSDAQTWKMQGLPGDNYSTENAIITTKSTRWPFLVDPQQQGSKWIRSAEGLQLKIVYPKKKDYLIQVAVAVSLGQSVLIQDAPAELDVGLNQLLMHRSNNMNKQPSVKIGEQEVDYNESFRLVIATRIGKPAFSPDLHARVTVINFGVTREGMEGQLLATVLNYEKPDLERQKIDLSIKVASGKKQLIDLENKILKLLSFSSGNLLDDSALIAALTESKAASKEVEKGVIAAERTEKEIDATRSEYLPAAVQATISYSVINDMSAIDPMYQFSFEKYVAEFIKSIVTSHKDCSDDSKERIETINRHHISSVIRMTSFGLFERHKLLFTLHLCISLHCDKGREQKEQVDALLRIGSNNNMAKIVSKIELPEWIDDSMHNQMMELSTTSTFDHLISSVKDCHDQWREWVFTEKPESCPLPTRWRELSEVEKLCVLRVFRPDRLHVAFTRFVVNTVGRECMDHSSPDIKDLFQESDAETPIIFILAPGVDPADQVKQQANKLGAVMDIVALGQGAEPIALANISRGLVIGRWVFLVNCHLMPGLMPVVEQILEDGITNKQVHSEFRLWLSSAPTRSFPLSLLQRGIKFTTEPPRGIRSNLLKLYGLINEEEFSLNKKNQYYSKLLFSLAWLHSVLLERKRFKTQGYNVPYQFSESDFLISYDMIVNMLDSYPEQVPFEAMQYMIGEVNYGGRITDEIDRILVQVLVKDLISPIQFVMPDYSVCEGLRNYIIPQYDELEHYLEYIRALSIEDPPELFGQSSNADIYTQIQESKDLIYELKSFRGANNILESEEQLKLGEKLAFLGQSLPQALDLEAISRDSKIRGDHQLLQTVLFQEAERYNNLIVAVSKGLKNMTLVIEGSTMDYAYFISEMRELANGQVPQSWSFAYLSDKKILSWMRDLNDRIQFINDWAKNGIPTPFWLGGLTYPSSFLSVILQKFARSTGAAVDSLIWEFHVVASRFEMDESVENILPVEGVVVKGLHLVGARWDYENNCLAEALPMELLSKMPDIYFKPVEKRKKTNSEEGFFFSCPLYVYPIRTGSRERPSFTLFVELPSGSMRSSHWIKRGAALLLTTSD